MVGANIHYRIKKSVSKQETALNVFDVSFSSNEDCASIEIINQTWDSPVGFTLFNYMHLRKYWQ